MLPVPSRLRCVSVLVAVLALPLQDAAAQDTTTASSTPWSAPDETVLPRGTLMIVGGGATRSLHRRFVKLAGGPDAEIVCVPTALPHGKLSGWCRRFFRDGGVPKKNRTVLHTRKRKKATTNSFVQPLRTAGAVWFTGGRQWRLVEAYAGTQTLAAFHDVLRRGGVIGGTSAGASIQGSFLIRGDPKTKDIVVGKYTEGFAFLPQSAIDQHLRARNREDDLVAVIRERPHLLGLGVDEGTAAIVRRDTVRVVGKGVVAIYDAQYFNNDHRRSPPGTKTPEGKEYFFLRSGDRYDLRDRKIVPDEPENPR